MNPEQGDNPGADHDDELDWIRRAGRDQLSEALLRYRELSRELAARQWMTQSRLRSFLAKFNWLGHISAITVEIERLHFALDKGRLYDRERERDIAVLQGRVEERFGMTREEIKRLVLESIPSEEIRVTTLVDIVENQVGTLGNIAPSGFVPPGHIVFNEILQELRDEGCVRLSKDPSDDSTFPAMQWVVRV